MPHRYNEMSLAEQKRARASAREFVAFTKASREFLTNARRLDEEVNFRLKQKAEQARFLGAQVADPFAPKI